MSTTGTFFYAPVPHTEAIDFIATKPVVTQEVFNNLLPELKARAFTIAGIEAFDTLSNVRSLLSELPAGGDWDTQKREILAEISPYLVTADDPEERKAQENGAERRAELLLRTHGFQAYNAAAYREMDAQRDVFPYWQYQSLGDGRVRAAHAALDGIVLPAASSFWQSHYPPWEWGCRCQVIPLSPEDRDEIKAADAALPKEERRVLEGPDLAKLENERILVRHADVLNGKGMPTPINVSSAAERGVPGAFSWHPGDLRLTPAQLEQRYAHDPQTFAAFKGWAEKQPIPELKQTVWEWLSGGGSSSSSSPKPKPQPAPGPSPSPTPAPSPAPAPVRITPPAVKAVEDYATELQTIAEAAQVEMAAAEVDLQAAKAKGDWMAAHRADQTVQAAREKAKVSMHGLLELPSSERTTVHLSHIAITREEAAGIQFVQRFTSADVLKGADVRIVRKSTRAHADIAGAFIDGKIMEARTVIHELGHIVEQRDPALLQRSVDFRDARTVGEKPKWLGPGYKRNEKALEDEWVKKGGRLYSGKVYRNALGADGATEIVSMGIERFYVDPASFYAQDPDYFRHVLNLLRNTSPSSPSLPIV